MGNLKQWILEVANGEPVEAVTIGRMGWGGNYNSEFVPSYDAIPKNKAMPWDEAAKWLDYDFDSDYGSVKCQAIYAWTKSRVIFVSQYDGSTSINYVPRNPSDEEPRMPGG
jgi:hypothetical protein